MKTLVVLSALTAVALAAPALLEEGAEDFKQVIANLPGTFKRERKSTQEQSHTSNSAPVAPVNLPSTSQISEFGVSGRSFGLKKPIIIKQKHGYHVYRDSDEEQAESGETCGKQVKVKLCDVKSEDLMRSTTIEDIDSHMTEKDMKHSIQLAKEAVENLQRDLKQVERIPGTKATAWKHGHSESDAELHQDIEVARVALEHIHKNFENLESGRTTMLNALQNAHLTIAKTENQRLAQWKEAMDTIQKNVEIAKNIEDSFKAVSGETGLLFSDDIMVDSNKQELNKMPDHFMRTTDDMVTKDENNVESKNCKIDHAHEKSSETEHKKLIGDDMAPSASTMSEKKVENFHQTANARHTSELSNNPLDEAHKEKEADLDTMTLGDILQKNSLVSESMKTLEENKERKTEPEPKDNKLSLKENIDSVSASTNEMKSVEAEDMLLERQAAAITHEVQLQQSLKHDEHLKKMDVIDMQHPEIKSAEHIDEHLHKHQAKQVDTTMLVKAAEEVPANTQKELLADNRVHENTAHKGHLEQQLSVAKMAHQEDLKQQAEIIAPTNNAEQLSQQHKQSLLHPEMRTANDLKHIQQHQLVDPSQTRWANDKNFQMQMESMKSADAIHSQTMDHSQNMDHAHKMQHPGHHHHVAHAMHNHNLDTPAGHGQLHSRFPDNFMAQGKSADMDMQSYYMGMRDGSGVGPEGQKFRWKPAHESSRSAYGAVAPAASSGGAVGLFPNANVGSCGIPLLLSCNPSVVSGSLAKAHPAPYSAPAYRTEDDFNFHTKRDVKKTHENQPSHRSLANGNLKTSTVLVAKQ